MLNGVYSCIHMYKFFSLMYSKPLLVFVGFLCGRCANDANKGTALSLIECVSCEDWHVVIFAVICKFDTLYIYIAN